LAQKSSSNGAVGLGPIVEIHGKQDQGDAAEGRYAGEGSPETQPDRPLLDLSAVAVKELIRNAKKRGYVSHGR
jgi:hypothetical protein